MDGINLNKFKPGNDDRIDDLRLQRLKSALEANPRNFLEYWIPGGKFVGNEYIIGDLHGGAGKKPGQGSTRISVAPGRVGVGSDFATGDRVGDLIDVYRTITGHSFVDSVKELEEWTGTQPVPSSPDILPIIPADQIAPPAAHIVENITYDYRDYDENLILVIERVVKSDGSKEFYPIQLDGSRTLPESNRPLYNLPGICDASTVVFVEGEKCVNYLVSLSYVATTCIGGSNAPLNKTDLTPLEGKNIILWADNDQGGMKFMESVALVLIEMGVASVSIVSIPNGKPPKWDAADATEEECKRLIGNANEIHQDIDITRNEFSARSYDDKPPAESLLLEGSFSLGSCSMVAAEGGTGKSMMFLDLALKTAYGVPLMSESFGTRLMTKGNAVFMTAEDTRNDIHTRIATLDWDNKRQTQLKYDLKIIPLLSLGSTFPLLYIKDNELIEHPSWLKMRDQIMDIPNLKLIAFDPMSMLVHANITSDPNIASLVCAQFNRLAVETGAAVLISHHFAKGDYDTIIETPEQARKYVRGTTGLVDSVRNTYCLWKAPASAAQSTCRKLGVDFEDGLIYFGATVKSNYKTNNNIRVFKRNEVSGLLECINKNYNATEDPNSRLSIEIAIKDYIRLENMRGHFVKRKSGPSSITEQINTMGNPNVVIYFRERSETVIDFVDDLTGRGELKLHFGSDHDHLSGSEKNFLDVPGGALDAAMGHDEEDGNDNDD